MATTAWDTVPVYGWWQAMPGVPLPAGSKVKFTVVGTDRVRRVDGTMIYPGGITREVTVGRPEDQDSTVVARIHDAMRAQAAAVAGFDSVAWEAAWADRLPHAVFTSFYAVDDPDVTPHGWQVHVEERIPGLPVRSYVIEPRMASINPPTGVPGINLALIDVPPGNPTTPLPVYAKGMPGGVAPLGPDGLVPAQHLPPMSGGNIAAVIFNESTQSYPARPAVPLAVWRGPDPRLIAGSGFQPGVDLWAEVTPPEVGTTYFTDFADSAVGTPPSGWTSTWAAGATVTVEAVAGVSGGKVLRLNRTAAGRTFLAWDRVPADTTDVEMVARWRLTTAAFTGSWAYQVLRARASGAAGAENGYAAALLGDYPDPGKLGIGVYSAGTGGYINNATVPFAAAVNTWYWTRFQVVGTSVRHRTWTHGTTEPTTWALDLVNTAHAAGKVGVGTFTAGVVEFDVVGVGTGGAAAPVSA